MLKQQLQQDELSLIQSLQSKGSAEKEDIFVCATHQAMDDISERSPATMGINRMPSSADSQATNTVDHGDKLAQVRQL